MSKNRPTELRRFLRYAVQALALGWLATGLVLFLTLEGDTRSHLDLIPWHYLAIPLLMTLMAWVFNAARLWLMAGVLDHPISYPRAMTITLSTEFAISATPAGMGGPVARLALMKRSGVPLTTSASMLAVDVAADIVFFALALLVSAVVVLTHASWRLWLVDMHHSPVRYVLPAVLAIVAGAAAILWNGNWVRWLHDLSRATEVGRKYRLAGRLRRFRWTLRRSSHRTLEVTRYMFRHRRRALMLNVGLSILQWMCRYGVLPVILIIFRTDLNPIPLIPVQAILFALSMLVVLPGGGGGVEVTASFIICHFVAGPVVGITILLWRLCTYHLYVLVGGVVFFFACRHLDLFGERSREEA